MNLSCKLILLLAFSILLGSCTLVDVSDSPLIICLNFDDGYQEVYQNALPILGKYGIKATCFVNSGTVGEPVIMTWEELSELKNTHGWEIGAHGYSHPNLSELSLEEARAEIELDLFLFRDKGFDPKSFALPYGICPQDYLSLIRARYQNIRSTNDLAMHRPIDRLNLSYFPFHHGWTAQIIQDRILQAMADKEALLIIGFHQVGASENWQDCAPATLEQICRFIAKKGLKTMTIREAMKEF
ncbi:MAG TPA: polysaccharide deacetylase family protein [Candidatus Cloacimonadota bacterium]|nr:polysaccharide deacetylase family protein [Candidatus Cloacimonadota bacterium]